MTNAGELFRKRRDRGKGDAAEMRADLERAALGASRICGSLSHGDMWSAIA